MAKVLIHGIIIIIPSALVILNTLNYSLIHILKLHYTALLKNIHI